MLLAAPLLLASAVPVLLVAPLLLELVAPPVELPLPTVELPLVISLVAEKQQPPTANPQSTIPNQTAEIRMGTLSRQ